MNSYSRFRFRFSMTAEIKTSHFAAWTQGEK